MCCSSNQAPEAVFGWEVQYIQAHRADRDDVCPSWRLVPWADCKLHRLELINGSGLKLRPDAFRYRRSSTALCEHFVWLCEDCVIVLNNVCIVEMCVENVFDLLYI